MDAQTPVLSIGSHIELGDCIGRVKTIKSYEGMNGQHVPYVQIEGNEGGLLDVPGYIIEEALQLS